MNAKDCPPTTLQTCHAPPCSWGLTWFTRARMALMMRWTFESIASQAAVLNDALNSMSTRELLASLRGNREHQTHKHVTGCSRTQYMLLSITRDGIASVSRGLQCFYILTTRTLCACKCHSMCCKRDIQRCRGLCSRASRDSQRCRGKRSRVSREVIHRRKSP